VIGQLVAPPLALAELVRLVAEQPAVSLKDGGVIASGADAELDELRTLDSDCGSFLLALEARERERTGIPRSRSNTTACTAFTSRSGGPMPTTCRPITAAGRR